MVEDCHAGIHGCDGSVAERIATTHDTEDADARNLRALASATSKEQRSMALGILIFSCVQATAFRAENRNVVLTGNQIVIKFIPSPGTL